MGKPRQGRLLYVTVPQIYGIDDARAYSLRAFFGGKMAMDSSPGGPMLPRNSGKLPNMNDARVIKDEDLFLAGGGSRASVDAWDSLRVCRHYTLLGLCRHSATVPCLGCTDMNRQRCSSTSLCAHLPQHYLSCPVRTPTPRLSS